MVPISITQQMNRIKIVREYITQHVTPIVYMIALLFILGTSFYATVSVAYDYIHHQFWGFVAGSGIWGFMFNQVRKGVLIHQSNLTKDFFK